MGPLFEPALQVLLDGPDPPVAGQPVFDLPEALAGTYGGTFGLPADCLYANFVSSLDGVVAGMGITPPQVALGSSADRVVMALLRACADAVVVGAGTFRAEPRHRWTAAGAFPDAAADAGLLRGRLGLTADPPLVVVSASGRLGDDLDALADSAGLVVTTSSGASVLRGQLPAGVGLEVAGDDAVRPPALMALLRERGYRRVLCEGGPSLHGAFLAAGLVDALFVTFSPLLIGGAPGAESLAGPVALWRNGLAPLTLCSLRRHGSHLFLRYGLHRA